MGKHNTKTHEAAKRSRARRSPDAISEDYPKYMRRAITKLKKRQEAYSALPMEKQKSRTRPGSMKMKRN